MMIAGQSATCVQKETTVAVLWLGAYRVIDGDLSIGQLIAFNMLSAQVTGADSSAGESLAGIPTSGYLDETAGRCAQHSAGTII
jgi:hypothetical protein